MERSAPIPSELLWENCAGEGRVPGPPGAQSKTNQTPTRHQPDTNQTPTRHQPDTKPEQAAELTAPATGGNPLPTQPVEQRSQSGGVPTSYLGSLSNKRERREGGEGWPRGKEKASWEPEPRDGPPSIMPFAPHTTTSTSPAAPEKMGSAPKGTPDPLRFMLRASGD
ncbi:hypothetical protein NPX13_g5007 [Xylaria arbuscula]|uniref:Uncharacterized protein n=1 Tax=Xylaria arbuscula TaxID=114810 RepID=A0A9W8TNJ9_9PEZI|nr:hypothetical protein NPX13_g5007 [Xylaria arbuscula]